MLAQGRVRTRVSSGSGVDRYLTTISDSFFKTARRLEQLEKSISGVTVSEVTVAQRKKSYY